MARRVLAALLALVHPACGSDENQLGRLETSALFVPPVVAFGTQPIGELHTLTTRLSNSGPDRLSVIDVRFDPPYDAFDARRLDGSTLRGASVVGSAPIDIVVRYAPTRAGVDDTTMIVQFQASEARVPITATARAKAPAAAHLTPASILFQPVEVGRDVTQAITVENQGESAGAVEVARLAPPFFLTEAGGRALGDAALDPGGSRTLEVHFRPTASGAFDETAAITLGDGPGASLVLRGSALDPGALDCDAASIDFGAVERGTSAVKAVHCTRSGGPFTLDAATLDGGAPFALSGAPASGTPIDQLDLTVTFQASGLPATHQTILHITSALGAQLAIPVSGRVVPPAPASTDLGVELTWSTGGVDLDLHLVRAGALPFSEDDDCYFEHKHPDWGVQGSELDDPFLDNDNRTGFGPETVHLARASETYDLYVQYFDYQDTPLSTLVTVTYRLRGASTVVTRVMESCGSTWHVGTLHFESGTPVIQPVDTESRTWASRTFECP